MATKPQKKGPNKGKRSCTKTRPKQQAGRLLNPRSGHIARPKSSLKTGMDTELKLNPADYIDRVRMAIIELGTVNQRGEPAWSKIALIVGISVKTMARWRTQSSGYYHAGFAEMVEEAVEAVDAGEIQRGLLNVAKPHRVVKRIRQRKDTGPKPPPRSWNKAATIAFARIVLGIEIDENKTLPEIRLIIETECEKRAQTKLVVVREEVTEEIDVGAARIALPNVGPKKKRWKIKETTEHDVSDEVKDFIGWCNDRSGGNDTEDQG